MNPHHCSKRVGDVDPGGVANLYGLWDWVGMAPCMGPMSPVRAHSLWAGLCPEKLVKQFIDETGDFVARVRLYVIIKAILSLKPII